MNRKRIISIIIILATVVLGGIAVFTAIRLYQLRQEPVAPTAPTSEPAAAAPDLQSCSTLAFTIGAQEPTDAPTEAPTDEPTSAPTDAPTDTPTDTPATATAEPSLPDAGVSLPTFMSAAVGLLLIIGSLILVF